MISREERWAAIKNARHLVESGVIPSRAYTLSIPAARTTAEQTDARHDDVAAPAARAAGSTDRAT